MTTTKVAKAADRGVVRVYWTRRIGSRKGTSLVVDLATARQNQTGCVNGCLSTLAFLRTRVFSAVGSGFRVALATVLFAAVVSPAAAAEWFATTVKGTVLSLVGKAWHEVEPGPLPTSYNAIRTLQSGRLELQNGAAAISVGRNTAFELFANPEGGSTLIRQYSGQVTLRVLSSTVTELRLEALDTAIVVSAGWVSVGLANERAEIAVSERGVAAVIDLRSGHSLMLVNGQSASRRGDGDVELVGSTGSGGSGPGSTGGPANGNAGNAGGAGASQVASGSGENGHGGGNSANGNASGNGPHGNNSGNGPSGNGPHGNNGSPPNDNNSNGASGDGAKGQGNAGAGNNGASGSAKANENTNGKAGGDNSNADGAGGASGAEDKGEKGG
jgi:hypothetical protein